MPGDKKSRSDGLLAANVEIAARAFRCSAQRVSEFSSLRHDAVDVAVEVGDAVSLADEVATEALADGAGMAEVGALGTAGDVELDVVDVVDEAPEVDGEFVCEVPV